MKKTEFDEDRVARALAERDGGRPVSELAEVYGVSDVTLYKWERQYTGLNPEGIRQLRQLRDENRALRRTVESLEKDNRVLQEILAKKP